MRHRLQTSFLLTLATLLVGLSHAGVAAAGELVTLAAPSAHVDPAKIQFNGLPTGTPLRVNVLLPDGYDPAARYPVLYLLHGHGDNYATMANPARGNIAEIARDFPGIVVMPEAARGWYANWWNDGARGEPGWERYHLDELIPMIEQRFPILPGRSNHAIAGLSMGGEGAVFYAEQRPGYFGSVASFSGALSIRRPEWAVGIESQGEHYDELFGDPILDEPFYWEGHDPTALVESLRHTRVYVTVGDGTPANTDEARNWFGAIAEGELNRHAEDFVAAAQRAGVDVTYVPLQGIHDWQYWRRHLAAALAWGMFDPVPESPASWTYETVAQHAEAWDCELDFAQPPTALATFVRDGGVLRGSGTGSVAVSCDDGTEFEAALPFERALAGSG